MSQAEHRNTADAPGAQAPGAKRGIRRLLLRAEAGAAGGLIAAVAVAAVFFLRGALQLHPLSVPADLASGLFGNANGASAPTNTLGSNIVLGVEILGYSIVHLLAFAAIGVSAAFILSGSRFWTSVLSGAGFGAVTCTGLLYTVRLVAGTPVALDVVGLPRVLMVNALAGAIIGMSLYIAEHGEQRANGS